MRSPVLSRHIYWFVDHVLNANSLGFSPNIQHLVQMLGAAMIPGSPQANMYFTLYGYNTLDQARGIIRDLKMVSVFPPTSETAQLTFD